MNMTTRDKEILVNVKNSPSMKPNEYDDKMNKIIMENKVMKDKLNYLMGVIEGNNNYNIHNNVNINNNRNNDNNNNQI